ncbi:DoxX family protein [Stagnihabitans tardus]|uniref:DoxX family membrane protein n=1 Tax=Stagnihabitans tardus TaxID=2699202 RepID=A0AAE4YDX5_9RHOB|nr:DoxX family protein [Stagnihabitans tardus]NBZ88105.1 DoxX family membrane protein [Stagnihabitans tardus]
MKYALIGIRVLLTAAFASAGIAKLMGVEMMVQTFDAVGVGQWFRYVTGILELGSAIVLWIPGLQAWAAGLLACTMVGAIIAHFTVLAAQGPGAAIPAMVLLVLALVTLYANRGQLALAKAS